MVKYTHIVFALLILLPACQKDEEIISGTITGRMAIYDQNYKSQTDRSGIIVNLFQQNDLIGSTSTDPDGGYLFENIPYGKYVIGLRKDKYIQGWAPPAIYHVGGYSPTFSSLSVSEIPTYQISLDSIGFYSPNYQFIYHLKVDGDTVVSGAAYRYSFIVFAGNTPDVSRDNFILMGKGSLADWDWIAYQPMTKVAVYGRMDVYNFDRNIDQLKSGVIYLRMYPLASGQGYGINQFYPEALGKPSNVISFVWKDLVGSN
jgi:hypothetical protein